MAQKKSKNPTIKDVASLAGVSVASVSRFLNNNKGHLSKEKARIIGRAIAMLDYVPNNAARSIVTNKSTMIAVVMANIDDYFSTEVFKGASNVLKSAGYQAFLLDIGADQKQEKLLLKKVRTQQFDGLILQPSGSNVDIISDEILHDLPTIIVDRPLATRRWIQVISNNYEASKKATEYFINNKGCKQIIVLTSKISVASTRKERYEGMCDIAKQRQIHVIEIPEKHFNHEKILKEIINLLNKNLREKKKTLIFCFKERWLSEFIPIIMAKGYLKNNQIMVTGFADTKMTHALLPNSRLISQNPYQMGAIAAELLLQELKNKDFKPKRIINVVKVHF